jgi:hypothetical protein
VQFVSGLLSSYALESYRVQAQLDWDVRASIKDSQSAAVDAFYEQSMADLDTLDFGLPPGYPVDTDRYPHIRQERL